MRRNLHRTPDRRHHTARGGGGSTAGATDPAILKAGTIPNGFSSMGGQTHNPHNTDYGPVGSNGGTGASIAASFAQLGFGTDTGGSVRGPSSANGIVGLRPTYGLLSHTGIVPNALSLDTAGPMARSVYEAPARRRSVSPRIFSDTGSTNTIFPVLDLGSHDAFPAEVRTALA
jgi:hypothetical protein